MSDMVDYVGTQSGRKFHFLDPKVEDVHINDIGHGLARLPRWLGQTREVITVAQHSVLVCRMLRYGGYTPMIQMQGLMHDAAEAYLGDVPSPIKKHLPEFQAMELLVESTIFEAFGIQYPIAPCVKMADHESFRWEYRDLMGGDACSPPISARATLVTWDTMDAEDVFFEEFDALFDAVHEVSA